MRLYMLMWMSSTALSTAYHNEKSYFLDLAGLLERVNKP